MSLAWHTAAFSRMIPLQPLSDLIGDAGEAAAEQSPDEMIFNMQALAARSRTGMDA